MVNLNILKSIEKIKGVKERFGEDFVIKEILVDEDMNYLGCHILDKSCFSYFKIDDYQHHNSIKSISFKNIEELEKLL